MKPLPATPRERASDRASLRQSRIWARPEHRRAVSEAIARAWQEGAYAGKRMPLVKPAQAARARELRRAGLGTTAIARRLGCCKASVLRWAPSTRPPQGPRLDVDNEAIRHLRQLGTSWNRMAHQLGCSRCLLLRRAEKLGIQ